MLRLEHSINRGRVYHTTLQDDYKLLYDVKKFLDGQPQGSPTFAMQNANKHDYLIPEIKEKGI